LRLECLEPSILKTELSPVISSQLQLCLSPSTTCAQRSPAVAGSFIGTWRSSSATQQGSSVVEGAADKKTMLDLGSVILTHKRPSCPTASPVDGVPHGRPSRRFATISGPLGSPAAAMPRGAFGSPYWRTAPGAIECWASLMSTAREAMSLRGGRAALRPRRERVEGHGLCQAHGRALHGGRP
jgi:hypothetical protein